MINQEDLNPLYNGDPNLKYVFVEVTVSHTHLCLEFLQNGYSYKYYAYTELQIEMCDISVTELITFTRNSPPLPYALCLK